MGILAGETTPAGKLQRLQPTTVWVQATSTVSASQTNADVPGCTLTFTTQTAGAQVTIRWTGDIRCTNAAATFSSIRANIDAGAATSPVFVLFQGSAAGQGSTGAQTWVTTLASAGSHTIKLQATTSTNTVVQTYTTLTVTITEVV